MSRNKDEIEHIKKILTDHILPNYSHWSIFSRYFLETEYQKIEALPFTLGSTKLSKEQSRIRQRFRFNMACAMKDLGFRVWTCTSNKRSIRTWIRKEALERLRSSQEEEVKA